MVLSYRSLLFTPGHKRDMLEKAVSTDTDAVIFDLEDAVPIDERDMACEIVATTLLESDAVSSYQGVVFVRAADPVQDVTHIEDKGAQPDGYLLPKVTSAEVVEEVASALEERDSDATLIPLLENGAGVLNAEAIGAHNRVEALGFGAEDYTAAVGATRTNSDHEIQFARQRVVAAAEATGVGTIDTVYTDFSNEEGLRQATTRSIEIGYDAKPAIHPDQLSIINQAYTPDSDQIEWARNILNADGVGDERNIGAVNVDGEMIDAPLVDRARLIAERAQLAGEW